MNNKWTESCLLLTGSNTEKQMHYLLPTNRAPKVCLKVKEAAA